MTDYHRWCTIKSMHTNELLRFCYPLHLHILPFQLAWLFSVLSLGSAPWFTWRVSSCFSFPFVNFRGNQNALEFAFTCCQQICLVYCWYICLEQPLWYIKVVCLAPTRPTFGPPRVIRYLVSIVVLDDHVLVSFGAATYAVSKAHHDCADLACPPTFETANLARQSWTSVPFRIHKFFNSHWLTYVQGHLGKLLIVWWHPKESTIRKPGNSVVRWSCL